MKRIWMVAGEASGDTHAAELMRALRTLDPSIVFHGAGGPKMAALAQEPFDSWSEEANVLGLWDVLRKYGYFKRKFNAMREEILRLKPDAVIFVDYPGFNLRMAAAIQSLRPRTRLLYYISPQVWAWKRARIGKMARLLDRMLCIFPFEKTLYERSGLKTEFVGHPMIERLAIERNGEPRDPDLLGLFPGSREREVRRIFPSILQAGECVRQQRPATRLEAAAASEVLAAQMRNMSKELSIPCDISVGQAHVLMRKAGAGLVCSGTATLEAAFFGLPYALVYRVAWLTYAVGRMVITIPYLGIVNILANRGVIKEFIQGDATPEAMAREMLRLLNNAEAARSLQKELSEVIDLLHGEKAGIQAARAVLDELSSGSNHNCNSSSS